MVDITLIIFLITSCHISLQITGSSLFTFPPFIHYLICYIYPLLTDGVYKCSLLQMSRSLSLTHHVSHPYGETQEVYDAAVTAESSSDWARAVERWKACVNETLKQTDECRAQCVVTSQRLPEETDSVEGAYEKAAGERKRNK